MSSNLLPYTHQGIVEDRSMALALGYFIKVRYEVEFNVWVGEGHMQFNGIDGESCQPDEPFTPLYLCLDTLTPIRKGK